MASAAGRPRQASHELLQEAAFELFLLYGYRATSVEQIAKTAGFSRATFFNFFSSKAELFWLETDGLIASLRQHLERLCTDAAPPSLQSALLEYAETLRSTDIPWALKNYRALETPDDLVASGASRVLDLNRAFAAYLRHRDEIGVHAKAAVITAMVLAGLSEWIDAGVNRGAFQEHLQNAFDCDL